MNYVRPAGIPELLDALRADGAAIICGGTDILVKMRRGLVSPRVLIDVSRLDELRRIEQTDGEVRIGAAVPENEILEHPIIADRLPLLAEVLHRLAAVEIRSRGSLGGNLVNASPAADSAVPLLLYEAKLRVVGPESERTLPVADFFVGPGRTTLAERELVREVIIPTPPDGTRTYFHKIGRRKALTISIASLGVLIGGEPTAVDPIRIAAGSVAPIPVRLREAERILEGHPLNDARIRKAAQFASRSVSPIDDVRATAAYRRQVIGDLLERFLHRARNGTS